MEFDVGDRVLVSFSGYQDRLMGIVVEQDEQQFVLFVHLLPKILKRLELVREATVQFVREGRLMGFESEVIDFVTAPTSLVRLSAPNAVTSHDLRSEPRLACCHPARLDADGASYSGVCVDVSASAVRVRLDTDDGEPFADNVAEGRPVDLAFTILDEDAPRTASCTLYRMFMKEHVRYAVLAVEGSGSWRACVEKGLRRLNGRGCYTRP